MGLADSAQAGEPPSDYRNERRPGGARVVRVCPEKGKGGIYVTGPRSSEKDFVGSGPFLECTENLQGHAK